MGYAGYVGRVGGLAVALGVGVAVATAPAVAWAEPSDADSSSSSSDSSSADSSSSPSSDPQSASSGTPEASGAAGENAASGGQAGGGGGDDESKGSGTKTDKKSATVKDKKSGSDLSAAVVAPKKPKRSVSSAPAGSDTPTHQSDTNDAVQPKSEPVSAPAVNEGSVVDVGLPSISPSASTVQDIPKVTPASESEVTPLSSTVLSAVGLAPSADGDTPQAPADSPLLLAGLAAFRRQTQQASAGDESSALTASDPSQTSLMLAPADTGGSMTLMAAAVVNSAPTAAPVVGAPDQGTGAVSVALNAVDAEGNPLVYSVTGQPVNGALRVDGAGVYTYTPTQVARLAAGSTTAPDFDSFTVSVADGAGGVTPVTVSVPVLPANWVNQPSSSNVTGASPYGVAMVGTTAYVTNQGTNTVSVINTLTGQTIGAPIVVGSAPTGAVASLDGKYVFVSNRTSGTVSVIRTADNKVIDVNPLTTTVDGVKVGSQPEWMAINTGKITTPTGAIAAGTRLYVANYGSGTVSVIDISNPEAPKVVDINPSTTTVDAIKVGTNPRSVGFAQTANGPRLYVVNRGSGTVSVIDAVTNKAIDVNPATNTVDAIEVGSAPQQIVINGEGTRAYVTNYSSNSVSIIDTTTYKLVDANPATTTVDSVVVSSTPIGVALSKDGGLLYVANGNDRVSIIDTKTMKVVNTIQIDSAPETNYHTLAVRSDGALIVTDMADRALRVVTLQRGNTAPVAIANPTVGTPDATTGAVTGLVNVKDWDGDALSYTVPTQPSTGTVTFNATAGTYTFTPTAAARQQAAQTLGLTASFTIVVSDGRGGATSVPVSNVPILFDGNRPPVQWVGPGVNSPDPITGMVSFILNVRDPDGDPLTYTINQPANGTVEVWDLNYQLFKYTPTQAARDLALQTQGPDTSTFTINVSDGKATVPVSVTVPIQPANRAPVASAAPTVGAPNLANGTVSGTLNVTDPDGNPLTYTVITPPARGGVTVGYDGSFAYTPTQEARQAAAGTGPRTDTFLVRVTDTQYSVDVPVTVPISPASQSVTTAPVTVGSGASGVVVSGNGPNVVNPNRAYVVNTAGNSVTVVDTTTNTVTGTIAVGPSPLSLAISPDGSRVYVTNSEDNTVSVINTTTKTVVTNIQVPVQPTWNPEAGDLPNVVADIVVSPTGDRAYVTATDGTISVINTTTNSVMSTNAVGYYSDLKISADGRHLYGTYYGYYGTPGVAVLDIAPGGAVTYNSTAGVGPVWDLDAMQSEFTNNTYNVALSPDGRRMYVTYGVTTVARGTGGHTSGSFITDSRGQTWMVTGGYSAVSVLDIDPTTGRGTEVARITVAAGTQDIAVSPDGRTAYVTSWDGKSVTMIDTATNTVTGGYTTDVTPAVTPRSLTFYGEGYFTRFVVVGANGTVYVTDYDDGKLYATTVGSTAV